MRKKTWFDCWIDENVGNMWSDFSSRPGVTTTVTRHSIAIDRSIDEKTGALTLKMELPGVAPEDLEIRNRENVINIAIARGGEKSWKYDLVKQDDYEYSAMTAALKYGVLTLVVPRLKKSDNTDQLIPISS